MQNRNNLLLREESGGSTNDDHNARRRNRGDILMVSVNDEGNQSKEHSQSFRGESVREPLIGTSQVSHRVTSLSVLIVVSFHYSSHLNWNRLAVGTPSSGRVDSPSPKR